MKFFSSTIRFSFLFAFLVATAASGQNAKSTHYVCIMNDGTYHDRSNCALLQLCSGAKYRKTTNVDNLKPCKKCARPVYAGTGFDNIKRILGVKDRKQIVDSLGTAESVIKRNGYTMRILGSPGSKTVNTLEFFPNEQMVFVADSLLAPAFFRRLGLEFQGCRADTVRNLTPHPVTGKVDQSFTIEYRNCAIVERRDAYDDPSKYYYRLKFFAVDVDRRTTLEKVQLVLDVER
ncbi:MAG: hypothetical protein QM762_05470 [Chryseolinea sp.]